MLKRDVEALSEEHLGGIDPENWTVKELREALGAIHPELERGIGTLDISSQENGESAAKLIESLVLSFYEKKCHHFGPESVRRAEQIVVLQAIDMHWMDHIDAMAHLREQVAFSGYAQRDPLIEYQDQGFQMFQKLLTTIAQTTIRTLMQIDFSQFIQQTRVQEEPTNLQTNESEIEGQLTEGSGSINLNELGRAKSRKPTANSQQLTARTGRNDRHGA